MKKQAKKRIILLCYILFILISFGFTIRYVYENKQLKKEKVELSNYYIRVHTDYFWAALNNWSALEDYDDESDALYEMLKDDSIALDGVIGKLEQSIMYYVVSGAPIDTNGHLPTISSYWDYLSELKAYRDSLLSGVEGEVNEDDLKIVLEDLKEIDIWLQSRKDNSHKFYYDLDKDIRNKLKSDIFHPFDD